MKRFKVIAFMLCDAWFIHLAYFLAFHLRFEWKTDPTYIDVYLTNILIIMMIKLTVLYLFKIYQSLWEYASIEELLQVVVSVLVGNIVVLAYMLSQPQHMPRSISILVPIIEIMLIGGVRFTYRIMRRINQRSALSRDKTRKIMVIGAGDAGAMLIKELKNNYNPIGKPVAIIDDNIKKQGQVINNVPVLGQRLDIASVAYKKKIDEIIIAIPSADNQDIKAIIEECKRTKCKLSMLPTLYTLSDKEVKLSDVRDVQIEDLLGREQVKLNMNGISSYLKNKKVLVTGGGGSIGSELCRQIANFTPRELIILDIYENNAYDLQHELCRTYDVEMVSPDQTVKVYHQGKIYLKVIIASVRDRQRLDKIFRAIKPDVVFHAAAHKHVPLMEDNPSEAIKNNVFGTLNVAQAADTYKVNRFVLVSTDKAVNPTNVMGATKRACELIIQAINKRSKTEYVAVRFGNVLGSNGSVIPLFKRQIAEGGPLTVTHEDVIRYFMTISEAANLVIQAGAMAKGGEIFVLDMGEPVKIMDLAKDLIKLSGLKPYIDIPIEITGLRPGEKLYEELLMMEEGLSSTAHQKIFIGKPSHVDYDLLFKGLDGLLEVMSADNRERIRQALAKMIPTYKIENNVVNGEFMQRLAKSEVAAASHR
ncbi:polysaccharide biosynthesis protein [Vallitalea pronyensis]|uniref:Polysaccharide biosynthesis protein n=1 Tax=Vallitalea pronyensis TaxID=1348613 RepID=A0A8J8MHK9_9FIRM|nr:nucleoside-diphosphate sugar epimerase/dehydratase [Vallitalea pronyensis]QUI21962.1 polysaccharide biosynthesis protein [Vallitalea pronyensis]